MSKYDPVYAAKWREANRSRMAGHNARWADEQNRQARCRNDASQGRAKAKGARWSAEDDLWLLKHAGALEYAALADRLGRTWFSIAYRLSKLRKEAQP